MYLIKQNARLYVSNVTTGWNASNTIRMPLKSDISFSQVSRTETAQRLTLDPTERRNMSHFIQGAGAVALRFTSYITPTNTNPVNAAERYLLESLVGSTSGLTGTSTFLLAEFDEGNVPTVLPLTIWVEFDGYVFKFENCSVDSATIDFSLEGIAEITWNLSCLNLVPDATDRPSFTDFSQQLPCISNKLTVLELQRSGINYNLALIGGSLTINNNNTYYSVSKIGQLTTIRGHYTGNRECSGALTFYLRTGTNRSADLFQSILTDTMAGVAENNLAELHINIGGTTGRRCRVSVPSTLLEIPNVGMQDVTEVSVPFKAQETAGNEITLTYYN